MRLAGPIMVVAFALAAGCELGASGLPQKPSGREVYPAIRPGDTPAEVEAKWGPPVRALTFKDEVTGVAEQVWQYERVQATGEVLLTRITFRDGKVTGIATEPANRAPRDIERPDSASKRDME